MKAKHTPGPWSCVEVVFGDTYQTGEVAFVVSTPDGMFGSVPNCRLIAAAPDLLEALTDLRRRFHAACLAGGSDGWAADASCAKADAAIAKAEGTA